MVSIIEQIKIEQFQKKIENVRVYHYNSNEENIYDREVPVQLDQVVSLKVNKAIYLIPADCCEKKPPEKQDGYVVLFNKETNEWEQIKDCKGKFYYDFEKSSMEEIKTHRNKENRLILTDKEKKEFYSGKTIRLVNGKYDFYFTDEQLKSKIISDANMYLNMYDFYFNSDYPTEKIPVRMVEYREYLRGLNSEHNLKDRDIQNLKVMTYEEFAG